MPNKIFSEKGRLPFSERIEQKQLKARSAGLQGAFCWERERGSCNQAPASNRATAPILMDAVRKPRLSVSASHQLHTSTPRGLYADQLSAWGRLGSWLRSLE
ncbi:hypothetical protein AOLI_G00268110 [Acnodon oligacanthus]